MSTFFLQHQDLFEYDKFVGSGALTSSTPSFLDRYRACEREQAATTIQRPAMDSILRLDLPLSTFMIPTPTTTAVPSLTRFHSPSKLDVAAYSPPAHASVAPRNYQHVGKQLGSPTRRATDELPSSDFSRLDVNASLVPSHSSNTVLGSPTRHGSQHASNDSQRRGIPKLHELLIDGSTRAGFLATTKRLDDAKKIELLIGSKCVGRISAAASSNLPPAIRHRLEASSAIHQRRERLYALLKDDYARLTQ